MRSGKYLAISRNRFLHVSWARICRKSWRGVKNGLMSVAASCVIFFISSFFQPPPLIFSPISQRFYIEAVGFHARFLVKKSIFEVPFDGWEKKKVASSKNPSNMHHRRGRRAPGKATTYAIYGPSRNNPQLKVHKHLRSPRLHCTGCLPVQVPSCLCKPEIGVNATKLTHPRNVNQPLQRNYS